LGIFSTLKGRFTIFAVVLVLVALVAAIYAQKNAQKVSDAIAANMASRYASQSFSQQIHEGLFDSYKNLSAFLLDPTRTDLRQEISSSIQNAINASEALSNISFNDESFYKLHHLPISSSDPAAHSFTYPIPPKSNELTNLLIDLDVEFKRVLSTRLVSVEQYPSLGLGSEILRPNRIQFVNAMSVALYELNENNGELYDKEVYEALVRTRFLWSQMVSNFRLYMANRLGSFNEQALINQEGGIVNLYIGLRAELSKLTQLDDNDRLGFEASNALGEMTSASMGWYNGFEMVNEVHHSGEWRTDVVLIKQNIEPKLELVRAYLAEKNTLYEAASVRDIELMDKAARLQSSFMWIDSLIIVVFFLLTIFSFEVLVLRPVKLLSRAMKAVAFGESGVVLPANGAKETRDLMDAFSEMRCQVRSRQFELEHQALHDSLTGLANRTLLRDRLSQAVSTAKQSQTECALLTLDLDRFKEINESLGHHAGDMLVVEVATRLENMLREIDTVARLGGDEFAILLPQSSMPHARRAIDKIESELADIREINGTQVYITGTLGVALFPEHGSTANILLKHADAALHFSQNAQKQFHFYDDHSSDTSPDRLTLSGDLRDAISQNTLYLEYQPQFNFEAEVVVGVEALVRWKHPRLGYIAADKIISIAEQTGQIHSITRWVMDTAFRQCADWRAEGLILEMSVNLSVLNLQYDGLVSEVNSCLSRYGLDRHAVMFEITESAMMNNPISAMKTLKQLEMMGLKLVIDDFGTGFSSLSYLKQLPVEKLKLDKSFVISLDKDSDDEVIVRSTIELAHNLGLKVVAEGVESEASWDMLKAFKCDFAQGYYLSKPKSAERLKSWLLSENAFKESCEKVS